MAHMGFRARSQLDVNNTRTYRHRRFVYVYGRWDGVGGVRRVSLYEQRSQRQSYLDENRANG